MQKQSHRHLREEDRRIIYRMMKAEKTQKEIAAVLGVSQGTISKELRRNRGLRGYRPGQAEKKALERQANKAVRRKVLRGELLAEVEERIRRKESPEQIHGALRAVAGEGAAAQNPRPQGDRGTTSGGGCSEQVWRLGVRLDRRQAGERIPFEFVRAQEPLGETCELSSKQSQETADAVIAALASYKVRTITYDNGLEFAEHGRISETLGAAGYFCEPYHSWEKGGVENFNGLVRQYFPKGCDLRKVDAGEVKRVQDEINRRPRKVLGFHRPIDHENKFAA